MGPLPQPGQSSAKAVPLTPIRRLLRKLKSTRPIISLGKRNRDSHNGAVPFAIQGVTGTSSSSIGSAAAGADLSDSTSTLSYQPAGKSVVALQNEDVPNDTIIITTLPCYPFCCHEDLIMMSRQQLVEVALTLNAHLPLVMQIEISEALTDAHIRHSIEIVIGIVPDTPGAPKAARSWPAKSRALETKEKDTWLELGSDSTTNLDILPSPPTSPLAMRNSRRRGFSLVGTPPRRLDRLDEEDEGIITERPLKKRKVSHSKATTTRFIYDRMAVDHMDISSDYGQPLNSTNRQMFSTLLDDDDYGFRSDILCLLPIAQAIFTFDGNNVLPSSAAKDRMLTANLGDLSLDSLHGASDDNTIMDIR